MSSPFVVSVHIPKTAGTTLATIFSRCFSKRVIFDYDGYANPERPSELVKNNANFISSYFEVIHGHFYAKKYFDVFPEAKFVSTFRHPVDRVISQYLHEFNEKSSDAWYHDDIVSGRMDVVTFAAQPGIGDATALHMQGRPLMEYDLILITEHLRISLGLFSAKVKKLDLWTVFGNPMALPTENVRGSRENTVRIDDNTRAAIFNRTTEDNEVYREAVNILHVESKKWLV